MHKKSKNVNLFSKYEKTNTENVQQYFQVRVPASTPPPHNTNVDVGSRSIVLLLDSNCAALIFEFITTTLLEIQGKLLSAISLLPLLHIRFRCRNAFIELYSKIKLDFSVVILTVPVPILSYSEGGW